MTTSDSGGDAALERLLRSLPAPATRAYGWLCHRPRAWLRIPLAVLMIAGGFLGFLPVLGFWMLPAGILLLSEDVPILRRPTLRALGAVQGGYDRLRNRLRTARGVRP